MVRKAPSGPVPERSTKRRRRNGSATPLTQGSSGTMEQPARPEPGEDWHPLAVAWFTSLGESGQAFWYEPSDWQTARVWAELLSRELNKGQRVSSMMVAAWSSAATELLTTEGARRRMRLELTRDTGVSEDDDAVVTAIDGYERGLAARAG